MTDYNVLKKLASQELAEAAQIHVPFHSLHEGYAVILEEMDNLREEVQSAGVYMDHLWDQVRYDNHDRAREFAARIRDTAIHAAAEALQVAAMAQKLIDMGGERREQNAAI